MADEFDKNTAFYFKRCFKYVPGCVYYKNEKGVYLACSDYMIESSNFSSEQDIIGKTDYDLFSFEQAEVLRTNDLQVLREGKSFTTEEKITLPNGEIRCFEVIKTPFKNDKNKTIGIIGNSIDITDRKKVEKLKKVLAEQKIHHLRVLGSIIAHELRTPLGGIALNRDLIEAEFTAMATAIHGKDPEFYEEKIIDHFAKAIRCGEQIDNVIKRTSTTVNLLLNNINEENIDTKNFKQILINDDIQNVLYTYPFVEEEQQKVHYTTTNNFKYCGDPCLTQLIITNLLKNALYHVVLENKGEIYLSLKTEQNKNYLIFYDTGPGIPKTLLPKIFDRFVTGKPSGTGLGLAFCKMVMQVYGGDIVCESKEGEFTEFRLIFPKIKNGNIA